MPIYVPVNQINSQWLHRPGLTPAFGLRRAKGDFGFPKFGCLQLKVRDEKNLPVLKTTSGSTKILAYLKTNGYGKNRMRSQRRLWPCVGRRPESDPAGGVFGNAFGSLTYSVFKYKHQNFYLVQTSFSEFVQ